MDLFLQSIEESFEKNQIESFDFSLWPEIREMMVAVSQRNWPSVHSCAKDLFYSEKNPERRAFILQWAIGSAETQGDNDQRKFWMQHWDLIEEWTNIPFCRYLRTYSEALSFFYSGALRESEVFFHKANYLAQQHDYDRGNMRCIFGLALIAKDRGEHDSATNFLCLAKEIAEKRNFARFLGRIHSVLAPYEKNPSAYVEIEAVPFQIDRFFQEKNFTAARELICVTEWKRKKQKIGKHRVSLYIYLPLMAWQRGNHNLAVRLFSKIPDPILKIKILELKDAFIGITEQEKQNLRALKELYSSANMVVRSTINKEIVEFCGKNISSIRDDSIRELVTLLVKSKEPVTKETICKKVWKMDYDPVLHDPKIYKLIFKMKKFFGVEDLLINTYGGYQLNPQLGSDKKLVVA